ncbi:TPA: ACT domain-containing protein [Candidatus Poribacteria bacterium]|nr:ACT domain-containing protein [Candidatus Poribacteria bacterium]
MEKPKAGGIIQNLNLAKIGVMSLPDRPGIASVVLGTLSEKNVNVQFISHTTDINDRANIIICVNMSDLEKSKLAIEEIKEKVEAKEIVYQENVAMVSVYGPHFKDQPGIAAIAFSALASVGVNIIAISTSISTISCLIDGEKINKATEVLQLTFNVPSSGVFIASDGLSLRNK